jgi:hypothetical protein
MNCKRCGVRLGKSTRCPSCGFVHEVKATGEKPTKGGSGGAGCGAIFGGIFALAGIGCLVLARTMGDTTAFNRSTGSHDPIGPVATIVGAVLLALGLGIVIVGLLINKSRPAD